MNIIYVCTYSICTYICIYRYVPTVGGIKPTYSGFVKQIVATAHATFRILDLDGDGSIEAAELSTSVAEIFIAHFELVFGLLEEFQNILTAEPLVHIMDQFFAMMEGMGVCKE